MPDPYFNRVPSLPATDDGSGRPLTEDLSTGSDDGEAGAGPEMAGPDGEAEFTEADVAFLFAPQEANATVAANGTVTEDAPGPDAAPAIGESGRWFRPAKAKKYVPIPPEDQDGRPRSGRRRTRPRGGPPRLRGRLPWPRGGSGRRPGG